MRVLQVNKYVYQKGGAERVVLETGRLLASRGHEVDFWGMHCPENPRYPHEDLFAPPVDYHAKLGPMASLRAAAGILYSFEAKRRFRAMLERVRPDVVHFHNIAHQLSPSIIHAARAAGVPTVMTLHDYKLVCASYAMLADGRPCERCRGGRYYQCVLTGCTKGSRVKSLLSTMEMYLHHRLLGVYRLVDRFISPSRFLIEKLREMGFDRPIEYLPNFTDAGEFEPSAGESGRIVYFGRLSPEKGVGALIEAVRDMSVELDLVGDGPGRAELEARVRRYSLGHIRFWGHMNGVGLRERVARAQFTVLPSEWYENNPLAVVESFAMGKPVVAAAIGGIPELVRDGETGLTFAPGDVAELQTRMRFMLDHPDACARMGKTARRLVEVDLSPDRHYHRLIEIYERTGKGR